MAVNKNQFRRMSAIAQILNDRRGVKSTTAKELHFVLNFRYEVECCQSTVEKDLAFMREELDLPCEPIFRGRELGGRRSGYHLTEPFDFMNALKLYFKLFD